MADLYSHTMHMCPIGLTHNQAIRLSLTDDFNFSAVDYCNELWLMEAYYLSFWIRMPEKLKQNGKTDLEDKEEAQH